MNQPLVDVAVVGSANLDLVVEVDTIPVAGQTVLGGDLRRIPGGKGANQAVAAARLGRRVAFVGRVGTDDSASTLHSALDDAGVDTTHLIATSEAASGTALVTVDETGDNAIVVSPGANLLLDERDVEAAGEVLRAARATMLQLEVPMHTVEAAAEIASGLVVLNPAPAPRDADLDAVLRHVDVLVPNQTELAALTGHTSSVDADSAERLARSLGLPAVVVTLGAAGALVVSEGTAHLVEAPEINPLDTTAAGDAFCAALVDALLADADLVDAARWAVRVGAATTLTRGAQPSLPKPHEVDQRLAAAVPSH